MIQKFILAYFHLKMLWCYIVGHDWGKWEDQKYVSITSRECNRCKLNESNDYTLALKNGPTTHYSMAVGFNWKEFHPWRVE